MEKIIWKINRESDKAASNEFWKKLQSKVDAWARDVFPIDIINQFIDLKTKSDWKDNIYKRIHVLAADGKYYSLINDVDRIEFRRKNETEPYQLYMYLNTDKNGELQVFTPTFPPIIDNDGLVQGRPMKVYSTREVAIDHVIPLNYLLEKILEDDSSMAVIKEISEARKKYRSKMKPEEIAKYIQGKREVNVETLIKFKERVLEDTICVLMEQGENSRKSDVIPFIRFEKDDEKGDKYEFIMAEHVLNPADQKLYRIFYTLEKNMMKYSRVQMKEEIL